MEAFTYPEWLSYDQEGGLRNIDIAFSRFLLRICPATDEQVLRLSALISYQLQFGNPAIDLNDFLARPSSYLPPLWLNNELYQFDYQNLQLSKISAKLVTTEYIGNGKGPEPIVFIQNKIYLKRYWLAAQNIKTRIQYLLQATDNGLGEEVKLGTKVLNQLFPANQAGIADWQKIACATALYSKFLVITGGPGTGKTTTVVKLLALLQALVSRGSSNGLRIALAAPTGKAAARLSESISGALASLQLQNISGFEQISGLIPSNVLTLHSLLGSYLNSNQFRHNKNNLLDYDILVIDEASMMDIELFDAVIDALPKQSRLVLLGDKDQLASVEAGAVLGELCANAEQGNYNLGHSQLIASLTGETIPDNLVSNSGSQLDQAVVMLRKSYRFDQNSGIGMLAQAVNDADFKQLRSIATDSKYNDLHFYQPKDDTDNWLHDLVDQGAYNNLFNLIKNSKPDSNILDQSWDEYAIKVLQQQSKLQILCAVHAGYWGTKNLNTLVQNHLEQHGLITVGHNNWYAGRPVMVLKNRPDLGLANGDIGIVLSVPGPKGAQTALRLAFPSAQANKVRWFAPARISELETVYALTVHKSQGSEFEHAVLVLPDTYAQVLTRELIYTGITRAKNKLTMVLPNGFDILNQAIKNPTKRSKAIWF